ncbi:EARP and GARP complex-interacting protein 1 isoform X3 [Cebus imitator]|uniref:EARP and GARP complex-interacting protein 1 n=1 Tax=Sapajus apella TaxID=9515 RepID=A0A6J3J6W0_SAPAP|nr:EARP and GARP complex-interacting protein 1 isoform X3 [Cebus imitator]XP_032150145.1 EARP and GARP complex-interacting protein 1 isoform X2 [Sapajus apella]
MEDDAPVIYGLEFQARALTPQTAETDAIRFLVGTQSLKYDNQIHIIDFDDENNIINKNVLLHQAGEIWHISASPADKGVLATCYNRMSCGSQWEMGRKSFRWPITTSCCGIYRKAQARLCQIYCIENAHGQLVRDLDFNPNKQYYLASCGDDCKVKFWDTRNVTEPVKTLEEHSHWVWNVRYNHSHDQLVLTGSSDSRVILSNMVSISSEPFGHLVDDDDISDQEDHRSEEKSKEPLQDNVIATYEEHEDSVYAVDWSSADPWLFASLSYDGRLVINRVPRALKYHILL